MKENMQEYARKYAAICKEICRNMKYAKYVNCLSQHILHILHIGNMQNMHYIDSELLFGILFGI
jgi:hypothetical protein